MAESLATELQNWAKKMGYQHPADAEVDELTMFKSLCNSKTESLWKEVISKAKPRAEMDNIRKNIILQRLRDGMPLQACSSISGSIGTQIKRQFELKQLQEQKKSLLTEVHQRETAIKDVKSKLLKKNSEVALLQNHLNEVRVKGEMLRIKKKDCESLKAWLDDVSPVAVRLCPPPELVVEQDKASWGAVLFQTALLNCIKAVQEYKTWLKESFKTNISFDEDFYAEHKVRKQIMWDTVNDTVQNISSEKVWDRMMKFLEENSSDMMSLASSVDWNEDIGLLSRQESGDSSKPSSTGSGSSEDLSAMHVKCLIETGELVVKTKILARKLDLSLEEIASAMEIKMAPNLNSTLGKTSMKETILKLLRLHCLHAELKATKHTILDEIAAMKNECKDLSSCSERLKKERVAVALLDKEIAEVKMQVEQGLLLIEDIPNKVRKAREEVVDELKHFSERFHFASKLLSEEDTGENDCTISTARNLPLTNSTVSCRAFASSTPAPRKVFSQVFMDQTALSDINDSIRPSLPVSVPSYSSESSVCFKSLVSTLKKAVSAEAKSFFKLPLELVPKITISSSHEEIKGLVVTSPKLVTRLAVAGGSKSVLKQWMQLNYTGVDSPRLVSSLYRSVAHVRAAQLLSLINQVPAPSSLRAGASLQFLKVTAPSLDKTVRQELQRFVAPIDCSREIILECQSNFNNWVKRPVELVLPDNLQVDGMTFKEWKKLYDSWVKQLR